MKTKIQTPVGKRTVERRIGVQGEYYQDTQGDWWVLNQQKGFVSVPTTARALQHALVEAKRAEYMGLFKKVSILGSQRLAAALLFETTCLSIGREFLPEAAIKVLDNGPGTVEYFEWLILQMKASGKAI